ncbi:MFS transporter [Alicyclobacillus mengziensis]|uniref:MFS transporter n=1 Tax=Alicyclobacillus mengziensis TaxID=2931921 RepID=UPI0020138DFF|nr:MFS transporter [Alicyclobacillus mengziensis]
MTNFALPWLLLKLTGSAMQMGFAFAVIMVPYLLISLPAGVYADRWNRKILMMIADAGRLLLILSIPVASTLGHLGLVQIYGVLAGMGALNAVFDSAYVACLPNVVGREELREANAGLQSGISASQILGPALAGVMVGWFGTANTLYIDSASFVVSILSLWLIQRPFSAAGTGADKSRMLQQIAEGLRFVWGHRLIRLISLFTMTLNIAGSAAGAVLMYHMQRDLHLSPQLIGLVMAGMSVGTVAGSIVAGFVSRFLTMGKIMAIALGVQVIPMFVFAFAPWTAALAAANFLLGFTAVNWNVQSVSLRQAVIPDRLLGRASSAIRMVVWGSMPIGSAAGGSIGQFFGAPVVLAAGGLIQIAVFVWGFFTPLFQSTGAETRDPSTSFVAPEGTSVDV